MSTLASYKDPCDTCDAFCCKTYPINDSRSRSFFGIPIKVAGSVCENLDGKACSIYDKRNENGYADCIDYTCFGIGPIVEEWCREKNFPTSYSSGLLEDIRRYMIRYFDLKNYNDFKSIDRERYLLFLERIKDLLVLSPVSHFEVSLYWQELGIDLLIRRQNPQG